MNEWLRWLRFWARWLLFCEANICMNCDVNSWGARSVWIKKCVLMNVICPIQRSLKLDLPISSIPSVQYLPPYRGLYRFLAHFYTILKKRITPADSLQAATAADCRDLRRYLFCPLFFVMAADFSSFHFICTVSCTIKSKMFVANTISDSLALLLRCSSQLR